MRKHFLQQLQEVNGVGKLIHSYDINVYLKHNLASTSSFKQEKKNKKYGFVHFRNQSIL